MGLDGHFLWVGGSGWRWVEVKFGWVRVDECFLWVRGSRWRYILGG